MKELIFHSVSATQLEVALNNFFSTNDNDSKNVIYINQPGEEDAWGIANLFVRKFPDRISLVRSHRPLTKKDIIGYAFQLSNHITENVKAYAYSGAGLSDDQYRRARKRVRQSINVDDFTSSNPKSFFADDNLGQLSVGGQEQARPIVGKETVTITIHNYNYGRFLRQCLDSVFSQSYQNIEVIFSDNGSEDQSWEIALEYAKKHPRKFTLIRNNKNLGPFCNLLNCYLGMRGRFRIELCSDDYLLPGCIQTCVDCFTANNNIAFVLYHRQIVSENGDVESEPPFYEFSCVIPEIQQAAVYMMAAVNPSISQVCYDNKKTARPFAPDALSRWWGARILDFKLSFTYPVAYIHTPLLGHRVHKKSDSNTTKENLLEVIGPHLLNFYFIEISNHNPIIVAKSADAVKKLASLSLRYSTIFLMENDESISRQYFLLAQVFDKDVTKMAEYGLLLEYFENRKSKENVITELRMFDNLTSRKISYQPPPGSKKIMLKINRVKT